MALGLFSFMRFAELECGLFEFVVRDRFVRHAHVDGLFCAVGLPKEEDFAGFLLPDLFGEVGGAETGVVRPHIGIGLEELRVVLAGEREVADDVEAVAAADGPAGDDGDDGFRHESDLPLDFEDVEATRLRCIGRLVVSAVLVSLAPSH